LIYSVAAIEPAHGVGDMHCGLGILHPGLVGDEYFMTKGHLHTWRDAAEIYIGLRGNGMMLLQDESSGQSLAVPLRANGIVYVPGRMAHRTINVDDTPLVYIGVYPARAGHDYEAIAKSNFRSVLMKRDGKPQLLQRNEIR
jgi:glucose-6-phosphate isomerase